MSTKMKKQSVEQSLSLTTEDKKIYDLLHSLPKTDLHCHLDGSLRLDTILELAEKETIDLGVTTVEALRRKIHMGDICDDLTDYLKAFEVTCSVLQTEEALERAAFELAEDAAKENIWHLEVRYAPMLHTRRGLSLSGVMEATLTGLERAQKKYKISTGLIVCGIRNIAAEESFRLAELAVAYKNRGVVAFDLAGGEAGNPAKKYRESFALILANHMNTTVHAGEAYGPESIQQALHFCGAHRIGHGTRLAENGGLLDYVNDRRIPLEVCLSSNLQTSVISALRHHPLRLFFDLGIRVSLNTDNRLITDTSVTKELFLAHKHLGFNIEEIKIMLIQGFKSAFMPFRTRSILLTKVNQRLLELTGTLPKSNWTHALDHRQAEHTSRHQSIQTSSEMISSDTDRL